MKEILISRCSFISKAMSNKFDKNIHYIINGSLDLSYLDISIMPKHLTVLGSLYLHGSDISKLPKDLKVGYNTFK